MTVYIAGKIEGVEDYKGKFARAQEYLEYIGYEVLNPVKLIPQNLKRTEYMPICLDLLESADAIFCMSNWAFSEGAKIERAYAKYQGKKILFDGIKEGGTLLDRYEAVMKRLDHNTLLTLPEDTKQKLKDITDLKEKVEALEDLADCIERQGMK